MPGQADPQFAEEDIVTPDHRFRLGDRVKVLRDSGHPLEGLIEHLLPVDNVVHAIVRLLPLDASGPLYHVVAPDGTVRLAHESQLAAAAE
jgi:hypothetical protein